MAFVKSLVVEAIKPTGYAVLNADDKMTEQIAGKVDCHLLLFSQNRNNPFINNHIDQGGMALVVEDEVVCFYQNQDKTEVMNIYEIPITFDGKAICNIENSLAAAAGLFALGIPDYIIKFGLMSFKPDPRTNAGRFNLFDIGDFQVMLDYGHNYSGYQSVIQFIKTMNADRLVGVIAVPGDRMDKAIFDVGQISGQAFSKIYIKEDSDLRGREPGEVTGLLYHGAVSGGIAKENIEIIPSEIEALETAIKNAEAGDLIVIFYESFDKAYNLVQKFIEQKVQPIPLFACGEPTTHEAIETAWGL
jgi:cyanophycin synthetase